MLRDTRRSSKPEYRARYPDARPFVSECSLKVRRLPREQDQAGALPSRPCANTSVYFPRREYRCRSGHHRPGCGGSTPPSCRGRVASIAAMQRSLKPQSTGQHRGDPPFRRRKRGLKNPMRGFGADAQRYSFCLPLPPPFRFNAPVAQCIERRASNAEVAGESRAGSANFI